MGITSDFVTPQNMALLTDLYQLTMCNAYFTNNRNEEAAYDLFVRDMPPNRSYLLFAGLEQVLFYLQNIKFSDELLAYLEKTGRFDSSFIKFLSKFKFTGSLFAMKEGTIFFEQEPVIRVVAPRIQAQLVETFLLNCVNFQTLIATKASRVVLSAKGRQVIDFSLRRTHGTDAGMKVARASYIGGCNGTSNVLGGMIYGIPTYGTVAHSYVMAYMHEIDAFRSYARVFPDSCILLIDTYDTISGAKNAVIVAKELERIGKKLVAVRLDSGDLCALSRRVRRILDENGLEYVKILASGNLDEYKIADLLRKGAKIDSFGVGTAMGTSNDSPVLNVNYKLSETVYEDGSSLPAIKLSSGKRTLPGKKQVYRIVRNGKFVMDYISLPEEFEGKQGYYPLLNKIIDNGKLVYEMPSLEEIRTFAAKNLVMLPEKYKRLQGAPKYPVKISPRLKMVVEKAIRRVAGEI
ncbi:MAG: nicotinate phosphoribosyltransferase [Candidatus Micrarchaeia archaeon]